MHPINHFDTDHLLRNLRGRTLSSGFVRVGAQGIQFVLTLAYNIALARLLTPKEFGLVAMVMTVIGFLQIFRDMQLSTATIQRPDITHAQVSNLFWLNTAVSGAISFLLAIGSTVIARFYHEPELVRIALTLSAYFILNGLAGQHVALLNRQMRFVILSVIDVGSMMVGFATGILLAIQGYGYWSLVVATLTQAGVRLVAVWLVSGWRPQLPKRGVETLPLVRFGANLTVSGFLHSVSVGCDGLLIGRVYGPYDVGLYSRATALLSRPLEQMLTPIYTVAVPVLSRLHQYPYRYRKFYLQTFEAMAIAAFLFAGLALPLARPLTVTILGTHWEGVGLIFAFLSVSAIYVPLSAATSWLYTSQGRGSDMMRLTLTETMVTILSVLVGLMYGPVGVAAAFSISGILVKLPLTFHIAGRTGPVSSGDLWKSYLRHLPVFLAVALSTWLANLMTQGLPAYQQLLWCGLTGVAFGALTILVSRTTRRTCYSVFEAVTEARRELRLRVT